MTDNNLLEAVNRVLVQSRANVASRDQPTFDANTLAAIRECIAQLRANATRQGVSVEVEYAWSALADRVESEYERASRVEREQRLRDLENPTDEPAFIRMLLWQCQEGGAAELPVVLRHLQNPPFPSADVRDLLAEAERRIDERTAEPLPDSLRRAAQYYLLYKVGDGLVCRNSGTHLAGEEDIWLVKVHQRRTNKTRGYLRLSEAGDTIEWLSFKPH